MTTYEELTHPLGAPTTPRRPARGRIVVGVDGSPGSRTALRWAADEARSRAALLEVVSVWHYPPTSSTYSSGIPFEEWQHEAVDATVAEIDEVLGATPGIEVRPVANSGRPARVLFDLADGAELLVVGAAMHPGATGVLSGILEYQVHHPAPCPIVIVPTRQTGHPPREERPVYL